MSKNVDKVNAWHKRLKMLETAVGELIREMEGELTPEAPRKRRNLKEEKKQAFKEYYEFGTKKKGGPALSQTPVRQ